MLAIAFLFAFLIYLAVSIGVAKWGADLAGERGMSRKKWGISIFILMMGVVFWDWLPMEILYKYECSAHAGLFEEKTIDEWKIENPGVWETLDPEKIPDEYFVKVKYGQNKSKRMYYMLPDGMELIAYYDSAGKYMMTNMIIGDGVDRSWLNQRFYYERIRTVMLFHVYKEVLRIVDLKTGQILVSYTDFATDVLPIGVGSSRLSDYKFWMQKKSCVSDGQYKYRIKFNDIKQQLSKGGK